MSEQSFKVEWRLDTEESLSEEDRKSMIEELNQELEVEEEITYGGQIHRRSITDFEPVGVLLFSGIDVLLNIYRILKDRKDSSIGLAEVNDKKFYITDSDPEVIENNGGTIFANDGDVIFHTVPDDMQDYIQLIEERSNQEENEQDRQNNK